MGAMCGRGASGVRRRRQQWESDAQAVTATCALSADAPPSQRTKASHPHVGGNEDADGVVNLLGVEVMVEQEQDLRPAG